MLKKISLTIVIAVAGVLLFAACERSASSSPLATPTTESTELMSLPTDISLVEAWGTSTAIYQQTASAQELLLASPTSETPEPSETPTATSESPTSTGEATTIPPTGTATTTPPTETPTASVTLTTTSGRPATYTLQAGEFPYCIARRFDVDPDALLAMNGLRDGQVLQPGMVLNIPQTGSFPGDRALHPHPATYAVRVDDTIYGIACYFGDIDPATIATANGLTLSSPLTAGQVLTIP